MRGILSTSGKIALYESKTYTSTLGSGVISRGLREQNTLLKFVY